MKCPVCKDVNLVLSERQGIEIDYCPNCRGIWLDRGELDKIIEKAARNEAPSQGYTPPPSYHEYKHQHKHHKKHWLSDLFD